MVLNKKFSICFLTSFLFFTGCSSEIEKLVDSDDSVTKTGVFIDSVVSGLNYECSSGTSSTTNSKGEFTCDKNNTISFYLGDNFIGTSKLLDYVTPYTLFEDDNVSALNLAQLLQTLDSDENVSNGIDIDLDLLSQITSQLDFNSSSFESDVNLELGAAANLVSENIAYAHMQIEFFKLNINADGTFPRDSLTDVVNTAPIIDMDSVVNATENQKSAFKVQAIDIEQDELIYTLSGLDAQGLIIDSSSGLVTFKEEPDFEIKQQYQLTVHVSDGALSDTQDITLNIVNIGESIPLALNTVTAIPENSLSLATVGNIVIQSSGDTEVSSIVLNGEGNENFVVNTDGLIQVSSTANLDFETKNFYALTATIGNNAGVTSDINVDISVTNVGEHKILSAVYNTNNSAAVTDHELYLYMSESVDELSFNADRSLNYTVTGIGSLNSDVGSVYEDSIFHRNTTSLTTGSTIFDYAEKVIIKTGQITDAHGATAIGKVATSIEKFDFLPLLVTGENTTVRNYALDTDTNETIIDSDTGLVWQKEDDNTLRNFEDATTYCADITLNAVAGFRLPTIRELVSITDKGRFNPAIDPLFINTKDSANYWSSTVDAANDLNTWFVFFYAGHVLPGSKESLNYVRCVR